MATTREQEPTTLRGLDALQAALRRPEIPIYRIGLFGRLQPLDLEAASRVAGQGDHESLFCSLENES